MSSGRRGFNAKIRARNELGQFAPSGGRNGGGWIPVHNDVFYLIDFDEEVKSSVIRLALQSEGQSRGGVDRRQVGQRRGGGDPYRRAGKRRDGVDHHQEEGFGHKHEASQKVGSVNTGNKDDIVVRDEEG